MTASQSFGTLIHKLIPDSLPPSGIFLKHSFGTLLTVTLLSTSLIGCSVKSRPVDIKEQEASLKEDLDRLYAGQEEITEPIGLYDAMARGIKYNIEKRDAVLSEMLASGEIDLKALDMLPGAYASLAASGRSNREYRSARSQETGAESLEPSQFEDQYRRTANLALSWNTLDAGIGYINTQKASDKSRAVSERRRKIVQNIAQDIREAYWKAASAQLINDHINGLLKKSKRTVRELEDQEYAKSDTDTNELLVLQKRIYDRMQELLDERDKLATAHIELAALMGLPPSTQFRLDVTESAFTGAKRIPELKSEMRELEILALMIRPEMREHTLLRRVANRDIHKTMLETFPGIGGIFAYNFDSNSFLNDQDWTEASIGLTQDILKIFSLPQRLRQSEYRADDADIKRMAMTAAVLTQLNVAYARYDLARDRYDILKSMMGVHLRLQEYAAAKTEKSVVNDAELLSAQMDSLLTRVRLQLAYAESQNSFGRVVNSLGLDPLPPQVENQDLTELSNIIEARFENLDAAIINSLLSKIREKTNLLDPDNGAPSRMQHVQPVSAIETRIEKTDNKSL